MVPTGYNRGKNKTIMRGGPFGKAKCSLGKVKYLCNPPVGVSILLCRDKIVHYNVISKYTNFILTGFLVSCSPLLILDT